MTAIIEPPHIAAPHRYTPEDLLAMPDGERYELVDGELIERDMGFYSTLVGAEVLALLRNFVRENKLGWTPSPECGYRCFSDAPNKVRRPDASFISIARLPADQLHEGYVRIAPDLAVEVVSPNDLFSEVEQKVGEYLQAGVRRVWVVNAAKRTVHVYRPDGSATRLQADEELNGEDVLPGFCCRVGDLFPPRVAETASA
jgi:Uma2 family endonuclease